MSGPEAPRSVEPDEAKPGEVEPGEVEPGEVEPDEVEADEAKPGEVDEDEAEPEESLPGEADGFGRLWTPHRMAYIRGENKPATDPRGTGECPFCRAPEGSDEDGLIVGRGARAYVVLNLYPYSPGHLMVVPYRHVADYPSLEPAECSEMAGLLQRAMTVVREVSGAQGFNIGMNQGEVAGAGIAAHLHQHVVPRWVGDTNFMPIIGRTRVLPQLLGDTRAVLAEAWSES